MKISIFKRTMRRLKRWLGYVEFLGRARRGAAKRLTLPDLEREVRSHMGVALTATSRPPRFAALRYALFGDWGLAPWITDHGVRKTYASTNNAPSGRPKDYGFTSLFDVHWWTAVCIVAFVIGVLNGGDSLSEKAYVVMVFFGGVALVPLMSRTTAARRHIRRDVTHSRSGEAQASVGAPMSEAIAQYVAHRLGEVKEDLVGVGSAHATTQERAQNEMSRVLVVWERLRLRLLNLHLAVPLDLHDHWTDERMPEHLRVAYEQIHAMFLQASKTLDWLNQFKARVHALVEEMSLEAQRDLALYEDIDLLDEIRELGGRVAQTALDARRSIEQALDSLQERMGTLREDVLRREELISSVVAALPSAPDRDAEWQRLENVVSGLSSPPRQKTLA